MKYRIMTLPCLVITLIALFILLAGCSGSGSPTTPGLDSGKSETPGLETRDISQESTTAGNRYLWGYWTISIDPVAQTYEIIPKREVEFHNNIRFFLENWPCNHCLKFENLTFLPNDKVKLLVRITHPFDDHFLDGFDVRGVPILKSTLEYTNFDLSYGVLAQVDGWTHLWDNPAIPGDLNPYVAYNESVSRRRFAAGTNSAEWMDFDFSQTGWVFDYAIDASWDWPDGTNFPLTANMEEAYRLNPSVTGDLYDDGSNTAQATVTAFDWQGQDTIKQVTVEAPDIFSGQKVMTKSSGSGNTATFDVDISNDKHAAPGTYPILIRAIDIFNSYNNHLVAYQLAWVDVVYFEPPPEGSVDIVVPASDMVKYCNQGVYIYNITAQVTPAAPSIPLQWWWTDPDEPATPPVYDETVDWESDTDPNDNHRDDIAGIYGTSLIPESFPGPNPPPEYHYYDTTTNSQGKSIITFKVSTYAGDNYNIHVRRTDTMAEDTSPLITVARKVTLYKNCMDGYYPDSTMVQDSYIPAYIDFVFSDYNLYVSYIAQLPSDANWLYNWADDIFHPSDHQLSDVGGDGFDDPNILGIAIYFAGPPEVPAQHTILGVGRIRQLPGSDDWDVNGVFIHELGHNFGLADTTTGVMNGYYTGEHLFVRSEITYMREAPAWE